MRDQPNNSTAKKGKLHRMRRYIFLCIILLALGWAATQVFLHQTSVGNPRFIGMLFLLYTGTAIVVLAILILATILGRNLIKLYFEKKSGRAGSKFKSRIVRVFIVLSLLPAVLLFLLAYGLISSQIEQWFQAPLGEMMEHSRFLAESYYDEAEQRAKYFSATIAGYIQATRSMSDEKRGNLQQKLVEFRHQYNIGNVRIFNAGAGLIEGTGNLPDSDLHSESVSGLIQQTIDNGQAGFQVARLKPMDPNLEISWSTAPIFGAEDNIIGVVLTETLNDQSVGYQLGEVMRAYETYEQLRQEKNPLRYNTILILGLSTLLIIFAFSWFALYLAKRITVPIQALEQGAAAIAAGNLEYRVESEAFDELAGLIASFNQMTMDLQENEKNIEQTQQSLRRTNEELDERRRYIETILQTIATGVISLDNNHRIRTMNRAAMEMLRIEVIPEEAVLEEVMPKPAGRILRELLIRSAVLGRVVKDVQLSFPGESLHLASIVTPLADIEGQPAGWVVVFDDMTELLTMEKLTAWQEVARRMAHEIKNPLTPIQLSAERVLSRYRRMGSPPSDIEESWLEEFAKFDTLLEECIRTITQETGSLKGMVDEFSRFSRLPHVRFEEADLHVILDNTLGLYKGRIRNVLIEKNYGTKIPLLQLDPEQMKRVFINLFDNALAAMAENNGDRILFLSTNFNEISDSVRIEICDTGRGFPEEYQDSLFLPYFSASKGGTGLGLAIARQIISDHNGSIRAEPNKPEGTKIIIDLPLVVS